MTKVKLIIFITIAAILMVSCGSNSVRQLPHLGNTPYQQDSILVTYATNPERALTLLDSALLLGNVRGYIVVRRSAEEMRSERQMMAVSPDDTDTDDTPVF